jgi:hypothetical protein
VNAPSPTAVDGMPEVMALVNQLADQLDPPDTSGMLFPGQPTEPHPVAAVPELYVYDEVLAALRREQTARRNGVA